MHGSASCRQPFRPANGESGAFSRNDNAMRRRPSQQAAPQANIGSFERRSEPVATREILVEESLGGAGRCEGKVDVGDGLTLAKGDGVPTGPMCRTASGSVGVGLLGDSSSWVSWESVGLPDLSNLCDAKHCEGGNVLIPSLMLSRRSLSSGNRVSSRRCIGRDGDGINTGGTAPLDDDAKYSRIESSKLLRLEGEEFSESSLPKGRASDALAEADWKEETRAILPPPIGGRLATTGEPFHDSDCGESGPRPSSPGDRWRPRRELVKAPYYPTARLPLPNHYPAQPPMSGELHREVIIGDKISGSESVKSGTTMDTGFDTVVSSTVRPSPKSRNGDTVDSKDGSWRRRQEDPHPSFSSSLMDPRGGAVDEKGSHPSTRMDMTTERQGERHLCRAPVGPPSGDREEYKRRTIAAVAEGEDVGSDVEPGYTDPSYEEEMALLRYFEEQKKNNETKFLAPPASEEADEFHGLAEGGRGGAATENSRLQLPFQKDWQSTGINRSHDDSSVFCSHQCGRQAEQRGFAAASHDYSSLTNQVKVGPGEFRPLRESSEIYVAIKSGHFICAPCLSCDVPLVTIRDAEMIICPDCGVVSPTEPQSHDNGDTLDDSSPAMESGPHKGEVDAKTFHLRNRCDSIIPNCGKTRTRFDSCRRATVIGLRRECWGVAVGIKNEHLPPPLTKGKY